MKFVMHKDLTPEHWFKFSLNEQLSNIGTDIERTIRWRDKGNSEASKAAFYRALELITFTILDPKQKGKASRKELCRVREALIDYFMYDNVYGTDDKFWQDYFLYFSYIAANEREARRISKTI